MRIAASSRLNACRNPIFPFDTTSRPLTKSPIVRIDPRDGEREVVMARWGLIPFWMKEKPKVPHINARAETVHKLPLFREAFAKRRCLIPATGFYEWQQRDDGKQPYRFRRKDLEPFAFAGIWEFARLGEEEILSAAIIVGDQTRLSAAYMTGCRSCCYPRTMTPGYLRANRLTNCAHCFDRTMRA